MLKSKQIWSLSNYVIFGSKHPEQLWATIWKKLVQTENDSCSPEKDKRKNILIVSPHKEKNRVIVTEVQGIFIENLLLKYL